MEKLKTFRPLNEAEGCSNSNTVQWVYVIFVEYQMCGWSSYNIYLIKFLTTIHYIINLLGPLSQAFPHAALVEVDKEVRKTDST